MTLAIIYYFQENEIHLFIEQNDKLAVIFKVNSASH